MTKSETIQPFWKTKTLGEMTNDEWESLCDGCGLCCLVKLEDDDTGEIHFTNLTCRLLDTRTCSCSDYENRHERVFDCLKITRQSVDELSWLPPSCAYRLIYDGKGLRSWHPLVSGTRDSVHKAGISVKGWVKSEQGVEPDDLPDYIIKNPFHNRAK